jgi:hypothetical protein
VKVRAGTGWQTTLADLSMILFLVSAAAVNQPAAPAAPPNLPVIGDPVALWRSEQGGPSLAQWLSAQPADSRQRLTIVAAPEAATEAQSLARGAGQPARVVLDPGQVTLPFAALSYDRPSRMAQGLQTNSQ